MFFFCSSFLSGQNENLIYTKIDSFKVNFENFYELSAVSIVPFSEEVFINKRKITKEDYSLNFTDNSLKLSDSLEYSIFDTLIVAYKSYKLDIKKEYKKRKLVKIFDDKFQDTVSVVKEQNSAFSSKSILGENLKSSGTLLRGFSFGTNRDLKVNSGLRLHLAGNVTDEIEIIAALTDENTPIQPEGNTERLEELDKVFIEIKHKNATGIFGDYDYVSDVGEFGKTNRKLKGAYGKINFENVTAGFSFASSKGKFNSVDFNGQDGVQGPYRLYGVNNENDIIIIAGSEKVYLDGKLLKRGENNDYIIEYSNGEVTFMPKILITNLSRIVIDFEYTNRKYERNFISANSNVSFFNEKLKVKLNLLQEGDNKNNPIDLVFSDNEKRILKESGDNKLLASLNGAVKVPDDSIGIYELKDTLINSESVNFYFYNPGSKNSKYNVSFSFVGANNGDYERTSIGKFVYVGKNKGEYLPIKFIPLPERNRIGNIVFNYLPDEKINLNLELASSNYDRNVFSEKDDNDNTGFAGSILMELKPIEIKNFGKLGLSFRQRNIDEKFKTIDRINEIEFDRNYNLDDNAVSKELLREFTLSYFWENKIDLQNKYGFLKKNNFNSERFLSKNTIRNIGNLNINYNYDFVKTKSKLNKTNWLRQEGRISYLLFENLEPGFEFKLEDKNNKLINKDSLTQNSLGLLEYSPFMQLNLSKGFTFTARYSYIDEKSPIKGILKTEAKTYAHTYSLNFRELKEINSSLNFSFRKKKFSEEFKRLGFTNNESVQIRSVTKMNFFKRMISGNFYYQTFSQRTAKLERIFLRVPQGMGGYSYLGDLNKNGIADESEFKIDPYEGDFILTTLPTDKLFPVINLKLNTRWNINFKKYFNGNNFFEKALSLINSETTYRVEEQSRIDEQKKIYLLNFKHFLNDSTTVRGFNFFQQDLFLMKNNRDLSFRFRFNQRKNLNQYSSGLDKSYQKKKSLKINFRMIKEVNNETEYVNRIENVSAPVNTNRSRKINANELTSDFSYRPYRNVEMGFLFKVGRIEDSFPEKPTIIDENRFAIRLVYSLQNKGRISLEAERTELLTEDNGNIIPYEITNGNVIGKNYIWHANFDYRIFENLQGNIRYTGRVQGKGKVINTFTAEARAYF